jgi:hypothetical protein
MGKITLKQRFKDFIASICWKTFLWAIDMTAQTYWYEVYKQERNRMCAIHRQEWGEEDDDVINKSGSGYKDDSSKV